MSKFLQRCLSPLCGVTLFVFVGSVALVLVHGAFSVDVEEAAVAWLFSCVVKIELSVGIPIFE